MRCPKCKSDNWKYASVIYNQRIPNVDTSDTSPYQTEFSRSAAPPETPPMPEPLHSENADGLAIAVKYIAVGYMVYMGFKVNIIVGVITLALLIKFGEKIVKYIKADQKKIREKLKADYAREVKEHEQATSAYQKWETAALCLRCGKLFYPDVSDLSR